jgi:phosphopantothenoylcysteine decarboxylase/phosphopantothenate--cysteine ligase
MNQGMWKSPWTQDNFHALAQKQVKILGPAEGSQACGDVGPGRMLEPTDIVEKVNAIFSTGALAGLKVLITAGPTHEAIDPVRYITNGSTGKMGFALAEAARDAGASVTLISGPVHLPAPLQVELVSVKTANDMHEAVMRNIADHAIFLAVAAVGDYRSQTIASQKMHKTAETMELMLERNPDIVATVGQLSQKPFIVGFAAETENVIEQASAKRKRKKMDMIIANRVGEGIGMGSDENEVTIITEKNTITLPAAHKRTLSRELMTHIANEFKLRETHD